MTTKEIQKLMLSLIPVDVHIEKLYSGKDHFCRCGCGGKYYYPNDRLFNSIVKKACKKAYEEGVELDVQSTYINIGYGDNRAYTIYRK